MSTDTGAVRAYFEKLGLEPEIADLYLALHAYGAQNISQLARNSRVERTKIYRLVDKLSESSLVEIETEYKRSIYKPAPITNLQILLTKKEEELRTLQQELQTIHQQLTHNSISSPLTHVQFYRGPENLKQMLWNQTKSRSENISILYENMQNKTNASFFERWVRQCNARDLKFRGIISDHFISTQQQWYATHSNERLASWESRHVADTTFPITHSMISYDDVVAYYNWHQGEIFGIEIYNQEIAQAQRQFFEMLWNSAQPVDDLKGLQES